MVLLVYSIWCRGVGIIDNWINPASCGVVFTVFATDLGKRERVKPAQQQDRQLPTGGNQG